MKTTTLPSSAYAAARDTALYMEFYLVVIKKYPYPAGIMCEDLMYLINERIRHYNENNSLEENLVQLTDTRAVRLLKDDLLDAGYPVGADAVNMYYWIPEPTQGCLRKLPVKCHQHGCGRAL